MAAASVTGLATRTGRRVPGYRSIRAASPVPSAKSRPIDTIEAPARRSTSPPERPPRPRATRAAAGTIPATAPTSMPPAADPRNRGRSSRRRSTGVPSSQSAVACGTVTGPRHSASRTSTRNTSSITAVSAAGPACSSRGAAAVTGGGWRSAR